MSNHENERWSTESMISDLISDYAAHAPEPDTAILAPELRRDDVTVEQGIQTFYNSSPPEAIFSAPTESTEKVAQNGAKTPRKFQRLVIGLVIVIIILAVAALAIGLGLGLTRRNKNHASATSALSSASATTRLSSLPSVALKSQSVQSSQASRTPQVLKHGILENTSIAGVSLLNGDRRVIFQQTDGNLRQAIYSKEGSTWAADSGAVIQNARNHTPLAVVNSYVDDLLETSIWLLFYVGSEQNTLECLFFSTLSPRDPLGCEIFESLPTLHVTVSEACRSISVQLIPTSDETAFLLVYEDTPHHFNFVYIHHTTNTTDSVTNVTTVPEWHWRNVTERVEAEIGGGSGVDFIETCITSQTYSGASLICIVKNRDERPAALIDIVYYFTSPGVLAFSTTVYSSTYELVDANHTDFCALGGGEVLWFNGSTPTILDSSFNSDLPVPNVTFPYRHFGSTYGVNATQTYVYHQVNDSIIAEEVWEKQSSLWQRSKNISIEVS